MPNEFIIAAFKNDSTLVEKAIEQQADINEQNDSGYTALMIACRKGSLKILHLLITQQNLNFSLQDKSLEKKTAMLHAIKADIEGNHKEIVALLLKQPNLGHEDKNLAMLYFARLGDFKKVSFCLSENKCDLNYSDPVYKETLLITAVRTRNLPLVNYLITLPNININQLNYLRESALIIALKESSLDIAEILINQPNIDLHSQSYLYGTPLTAAVFLKHNHLALRLLNKEEKFEDFVHPGAFLCAVRNDDSNLVQALINKGANIDSNEKYSITLPNWVQDASDEPSPFTTCQGEPLFELPVIVASQMNLKEMLKTLLKNNADINKKSYLNKSLKNLYDNQQFSSEINELIKKYLENKSTSLRNQSHTYFATSSKILASKQINSPVIHVQDDNMPILPEGTGF